MLNLGKLLTSMMLATGVATTTPVNHAENIITDYNIKLEVQNSRTQDYTNIQNVPTTKPQSLNTNNDEEIIYNFRSSNAYVNITGTRYDTKFYQLYLDINSGGTSGTVQERTKQLILNKNSLVSTQPYNEYVSTDLYIFQVDSYNYNIGNSFDFTFSFEELSNYEFEAIGEIKIDNLYFLKETYITYQDNWATYIQRQNSSFQADYVKKEIENVNNNFYYTKTTEEISATSIVENFYQDTTTFTLTPKETTYIAIKYTPMVIASYREYNDDPWEEIDGNYPLIPINNQVYNGTYIIAPSPTNNIWINGTNIIPDTNIEVIDIPGLMWEILTMPFAFVSQAFNLTLFPGTPYQLNISNLFLSIIAIIVFIWLITFFLKMKG